VGQRKGAAAVYGEGWNYRDTRRVINTWPQSIDPNDIHAALKRGKRTNEIRFAKAFFQFYLLLLCGHRTPVDMEL
jgi:hypothetical protein